MKRCAALLLGASALLGCGAQRTTERVFDGHTVVGPYIEPEAYAAFGDGVYREQHGDAAGALEAYRRAQSLDPDSPSIAVRIAALLCSTDQEAALAELDAADAFAPAWVERGRCLLQHHQPDAALAAARQAVRLDHLDPDANLLVARLLREQGATEAARAWLFAWLLADRAALAPRAAVEAEAAQLGDTQLATLSRSTQAAGREPVAAEAGAAEPLVRARAASSTDPALALAEAQRVLGANPGDADALVIALFAAHRLGDEHAIAELSSRGRPVSPPSADVSPLLLELLRQRAGEAAADAWLEAHRARTPRR